MKEIKVSYDGEYPCLCSGHLEVWVDGKYYDFGNYAMHSGGSVSFSEDWEEDVSSGEWSVDFPDNFPEELKSEVLEAINNEEITSIIVSDSIGNVRERV